LSIFLVKITRDYRKTATINGRAGVEGRLTTKLAILRSDITMITENTSTAGYNSAEMTQQ